MQTLTLRRLAWSAVLLILVYSAPSNAGDRGLTNTRHSPHAAFGTPDMNDVVWTGGFWADRFARHPAMIDTMWNLYMRRSFDNFQFAAGLAEGEFRGTWWQDGDFYKWLETLAWVYGMTGDPALDARMDRIVDVIGRAQMVDGYIDTPIQIGKGTLLGGFLVDGRNTPMKPVERWTQGRPHEVYNFGHLITAACVHYRATGKRNFLDIAIKAADHLQTVFGTPKPELDLINYNPPHIMGLVELYRTIGERRYLELAQTILDMRGAAGRDGSAQFQSLEPFRKLREAYGHAVLGTYLFAGAADVYMETGEQALLDVSERLWRDVTGKRLYITGGCTAIHHGEPQQHNQQHVHEAFGWDHQLHNATAYNETCANIGNALWNWRLLSATGNALYAEIMELVWYNSLLSAINIEGTRYFYSNVLRWYGNDHTLLSSDWPERWGKERGGICCPPNIIRTIVEMNAYAYGISDNAVWMHLYGENTLDTELPDGSPVKLVQRSEYPWDGRVTVTVEKVPAAEMDLKLRIPAWVQDDPVAVLLNGRPAAEVPVPGSYLTIRRLWKAGDTVTLELPMEIRLVEANPKVEEVRNQAAVRRGPIVYCLESTDLPADVDMLDVIVPVKNTLQPRYDADLLGSVTILEGTLPAKPPVRWDDRLYRHITSSETREIPVRLIPYYAWCNRGRCEMTVWLPVNR